MNIPFIVELRSIELSELLGSLPPNGRLLDFGAGTGVQAKALSERGFEVTAIDLAESVYKEHREFPIVEFDGRNIPLEDNSVEVILSSNVLEHVEDLRQIFSEFRRILAPGGIAVHAMPTSTWRWWTFVTGPPAAFVSIIAAMWHLLRPPPGRSRAKAFKSGIGRAIDCLLPRGHGTSSEGISELWTFSPIAWRRRFRDNNFVVISDRPMGLLYTGNSLFGGRISFEMRKWLAAIFGSSLHVYVTRPMNHA